MSLVHLLHWIVDGNFDQGGWWSHQKMNDQIQMFDSLNQKVSELNWKFERRMTHANKQIATIPALSWRVTFGIFQWKGPRIYSKGVNYMHCWMLLSSVRSFLQVFGWQIHLGCWRTFFAKHTIVIVLVCLLLSVQPCLAPYDICIHMPFVLALWVVAQQADSPSHVCCGLGGKEAKWIVRWSSSEFLKTWLQL